MSFIAAAIVAGGTAIGAGIQAWSTQSGLSAQASENKRAEIMNTTEQNQAIARSEAWQTKQFNAQQSQLKLSNSLNARNTMLNYMSGSTQMANNMINIWRSRRS